MTSLLIEAGHAVETVKNDYGEDLLVQTANAGRLDASRLWVQVKGTRSSARYASADGTFRKPFAVDHVLRWLRTADEVIVVLWDVELDAGWYAHPQQVDEWGILQRTTVTLSFDQADKFDATAIDALVWSSRLRHYDNLCLRALAADEEEGALAGDEEENVGIASKAAPSRTASSPSSVAPLLALDFLMMAGVIQGDKGGFTFVPPVILRFAKLTGVMIDAIDPNVPDPPLALKKAIQMGAFATVFQYVPELIGQGLPMRLGLACTDLIARTLGREVAEDVVSLPRGSIQT